MSSFLSGHLRVGSLALAAICASGGVPYAQSPSVAQSKRDADRRGLFAAVAGEWSCTGSFSNGRPLASDLSFTLSNSGQSLAYHHADRAPNVFIEDALWGPDPTNDATVSLAFAGTATTLLPQLFVAKEWSSTRVVFVAQTLTSPPFQPNRFTYELMEGGALNVVWEVERSGAWNVGDRISCSRKGHSSEPAHRDGRGHINQ